MKIQADLLKISSGALNLKGEKLEPEQQLVRREVSVQAPVKHGQGTVGTDVGVIPTKIITDQTAGEQAVAMRSLCGNCKHFRNDLWMRDLNKADSPGAPIERRRAVNQIRAALLQTQSHKLTESAVGADGDFDIEAALRQLGYCQALFSFFKNMGKANDEAMTLVHPASSCPNDVRTPAAPEGFFEYKDLEAEKVANANYDKIMNIASGKK